MKERDEVRELQAEVSRLLGRVAVAERRTKKVEATAYEMLLAHEAAISEVDQVIADRGILQATVKELRAELVVHREGEVRDYLSGKKESPRYFDPQEPSSPSDEEAGMQKSLEGLLTRLVMHCAGCSVSPPCGGCVYCEASEWVRRNERAVEADIQADWADEQRRKHRQRTPQEEALEIAKQSRGTLDEFHAQEIVERDRNDRPRSC